MRYSPQVPISAEGKQQMLRSVMKASGEGVIVWTIPEGTLSDCNEAAARILGVPRAELVGRNLDYPWVMEREDGSPVPRGERGAVLAVTTGESQPTMVFRVGRHDGGWAWVRSSSVVLRDAAQVAYAVVTTFVDVTELREAQQQVRLIANRLNDVVEGANVGTWELDLTTSEATRNARWAEILGYTPSEIEPTLTAFTERIHPADLQGSLATMEEGFRSDQPFVYECRARHKGGEWYWVHVRGKVVERDREGRAQRAAGVLIDIDARKRAEESLRLARDENSRLVSELRLALANVRTLEGLLPICMYCKSIRDNVGDWSSVETYVSKRTEAAFSHGICPTCFAKHHEE